MADGLTWIVADTWQDADNFRRQQGVSEEAARVITRTSGLEQLRGYQWTPGLDEVWWVDGWMLGPMVYAVIEQRFLMSGATLDEMHVNVWVKAQGVQSRQVG